jgi:hypothetical protein
MSTRLPAMQHECERAVDAKTLREDGNALLGAGLGVAAIGALGGLVAGAVCPVCIVATPALIGAGVVQRVRAARRSALRKRASQSSSEVEAGASGTPRRER